MGRQQLGIPAALRQGSRQPQGVHEVQRKQPALRLGTQRELSADREVQLALEGVQQEIHLVHQEHPAGLPEFHDAP